MPTILCCILIFIVWLSYQKSKTDKAQKAQSDAFWKREQDANTTRKKDLSSLDYITISYDALPFTKTSSDEITYVQDQLYQLKDAKIVNLSGQSNTDLKLTYGTANITELASYDQNFLLLIRLLNQWGELLVTNGHPTEAECVFSYAVSIGSDISKTFLRLAALYQEQGRQKELSALTEKAAQLTTPMKDSLLKKLNTFHEIQN